MIYTAKNETLSSTKEDPKPKSEPKDEASDASHDSEVELPLDQEEDAPLTL
ncbi:hypothetical protein GYH30_007458 [Glycine max]|nr:hypothetical protein GYH30_007458 [Glycine max]